MEIPVLQKSRLLKNAPLRTQSPRFAWLLCAVTAVLFSGTTSARAQPIVEWATVGGSAQTDSISDMALSPAGGVYVAGSFDYSSDWGLTGTVLYKYDLGGGQIGSLASRGELINGVAVDSEGNYYLVGRVWRPEELGLGLRNHFYLAKYSSTGTLLWERTAGHPTYMVGYIQIGWDIALDAAGDVYIAGQSSGPVVFGNVTFPDAPGGPLLCKYDPDGTLLWVQRAEGQGFVYEGRQQGGGLATNMALDADGNIVIAGTMYNGPANFGGTVVTIAGLNDADGFTAKYNPAGEVLWVKTPGGGVGAVDRHGNIYSGLSKYDPTGALVWERTIPGVSIYRVTLDGNDAPVYTGAFSGTVQLDEHVVQSDSDSYQDMLICKADAGGKFQWALAGSTGGLRTGVGSVVCDRAGTIYVAGAISCVWLDGAQNCDGPSMLGSFPLSVQVGGNNDIFVARVTDSTPVAVQLKIARTTSGLGLSWPVQATNYVLEATTTLPAISWSPVTNNPTVGPSERSVELPLTGTAKFFRLRSP